MSTTFVLLQKDVPNLGQIGDLVKVKSGFARNFLYPNGLAILADKGNKKNFEHQKNWLKSKKEKALVAAKQLAEVIKALSLTIQKPVGEEDKIFGAVTTTELADAFLAAGYEVDRKQITILDDIKRVGVYKGAVKLHPQVSAEFSIWVVAQA